MYTCISHSLKRFQQWLSRSFPRSLNLYFKRLIYLIPPMFRRYSIVSSPIPTSHTQHKLFCCLVHPALLAAYFLSYCSSSGGSCPVLAKTHQLGHQSHVCTESAQVRTVFSETVSTPHRMLSGHSTHRRHLTHHCINAADSLSRFVQLSTVSNCQGH